MSDVELESGAARPAVRLSRSLPGGPAAVWRAITEREELRRWFPCDVEVAGDRWLVGAKITFTFPPELSGLALHGEVLEVEPERLLAYTWGEEVLRFELAPEGGGTRLTLVNELPASAAARNAAGWAQCLDALAGSPPSDSWRARFAAFAARFEPRLGPQEGPPAGYEGEPD